MGGKTQSKVVEVQVAGANAVWSVEACGFGETTIEFSGRKSVDHLSYARLLYLFPLFSPRTPCP